MKQKQFKQKITKTNNKKYIYNEYIYIMKNIFQQNENKNIYIRNIYIYNKTRF